MKLSSHAENKSIIKVYIYIWHRQTVGSLLWPYIQPHENLHCERNLVKCVFDYIWKWL